VAAVGMGPPSRTSVSYRFFSQLNDGNVQHDDVDGRDDPGTFTKPKVYPPGALHAAQVACPNWSP
jgi:hypothetical protein